MTPLKAIRAKCLDCSCGSANEVRLCPIKDCALYEYRFGHNPSRKGVCGTGVSNFDITGKKREASAQNRIRKE